MSHSVAGGWIHVDINMDSLTEIEHDLGMMRDKSKLVLRSAINNAAKELNARLLKEDKKEYAVDKGNGKYELEKAHKNNIIKARTTKLYATLKIQSKIGELYKFHVSPRRIAVPKGEPYNPPVWYKGKVKNGNRIQSLALKKSASSDKYKAFVVKFASGHIGVVQRVPGSHMRNKPHKEAIKSFYSPSVASMDKTMYEQNEEANIHELLDKHIELQISRFLK